MITLRNVTDKDRSFIKQLYRITREQEMAGTGWTDAQKEQFCLMQSMAQEAHYTNVFPEAVRSIILFEDRPAGRLYISDTAEEVRLIDIIVLPQYRGKGIAAKIVTDITGKASAENKFVSIHVLKGNTAKLLYEKLGFKKISEKPGYDYMEWRSA